MLKGFLSREKIVLFVLIAILLGLVSFTFFRYQLYTNGVILVNELYLGVQRSLNPSQARLSLQNEELIINFKINTADQANLEVFLKNLGMEDMNSQSIKVNLGGETTDFIGKVIQPKVDLNLRILPKEIDFDNKKVFGPFDSTLGDLLENPSAEGSIKVQTLGENSYSVEIDNPEKVISEATLSGKLKVSEKLVNSGWWQLLSKLVKIKLNIDKVAISGAIILK